MTPNHLGEKSINERGFELIRFNDAYQELCSLQASSMIGDEDRPPGQSFVWLGAKDRMHLSRQQVEALIGHLSSWLEKGVF